MDPLDTIILEVESVERQLGRRKFLQRLALAAVAPPAALDRGHREFLRRVAATLVPAEWQALTGVDVTANIEHLLARGGALPRARVLRLIAWARRVSFLYGGEKIAVRTRTSRFVLMQKLGKALSSLCLVAFWGDERTLRLIEVPEDAS